MGICRQLRRKFVRFGGPGLASKGEWITEECGAQLYSVDDHAAQKCKACRNGHTTPHNVPVEAGDAWEFDPLGNKTPNGASTWANCPWFRPWCLQKTLKQSEVNGLAQLRLKAKFYPWFTRKV